MVFLVAEQSLGAVGPFVKAVPVGVLCLLVARAEPRPGKALIVAGLGFSALADWVIEYSFIGGLVTFLVTHLFYIGAFTQVERRARLGRLVPVLLWAAIALPLLSAGAGALRVPVLIYGTVIFVMIWRASAMVETAGANPATFAFLGALLFGISDSLLGYSRFVAPLPASSYLILGTYWSAQALIARSFAQAR